MGTSDSSPNLDLEISPENITGSTNVSSQVPGKSLLLPPHLCNVPYSLPSAPTLVSAAVISAILERAARSSPLIEFLQNSHATSLMIQWLRLCASTVEGKGSIPSPGTKILHALWSGFLSAAHLGALIPFSSLCTPNPGFVTPLDVSGPLHELCTEPGTLSPTCPPPRPSVVG